MTITQTNAQHRAVVQRLAEQSEEEKAALQKALKLRSQSEADKSLLEKQIFDLESQLRTKQAENIWITTELEALQEATSDYGKLLKRAASLEQNYQEVAHAKIQLESQLNQLLAERQENQVKLAHASMLWVQISSLEGDYAALKLQVMQMKFSTVRLRKRGIKLYHKMRNSLTRFGHSNKAKSCSKGIWRTVGSRSRNSNQIFRIANVRFQTFSLLRRVEGKPVERPLRGEQVGQGRTLRNF
jgi:predicted O-linked N-acetylglucosamine transferase (SPINDLY family)